jgi:ParB family chromosome partitioning protein
VASGFGLGRGLESLIPRAAEGTPTLEIPIDRVVRNPHQPRSHFDEAELAQLAASVQAHGVLQPIVVRAAANGGYELIAGERRLRAARLAGLTRIPAVLRDATGGTLLELAMVENLQRSDLNAIDQANGYRELINRFGLSHEAVARQVGKSRVAISNSLRLLDLAPETQQAITDGRLTEGHGRALAALTVPDLQRAAMDLVIERHLSVRQTEELVRRRRSRRAGTDRRAVSGDLEAMEAELRRALGTKVGIVRTRSGGRLLIDFYSDEELERLHALITRGAAAESEASVR